MRQAADDRERVTAVGPQTSVLPVTTVTETGKTEVWATNGRDTFAVVGGLAHGDAYAVTVVARNAAGTGPAASAGVVTIG